MSEHAESINTSIQDLLNTCMIIAETCFNFQWWSICRSMPKSVNKKYEINPGPSKTLIIVGTCCNFQWLSYVGACWKYEYIRPGPSKHYDYSWDVLQFPTTTLRQSMLKIWMHPPGQSKSNDYSWDMLRFLMNPLWRSIARSMNTSIRDHLKLKHWL